MEHAIVATQLDRVTDRVAEVERFANSAFAFIPPNDVRLGGDAADDDALERGHSLSATAHDRWSSLGDVVEIRGVGDHAVLDRFRQAGTQMLRRQRAQHIQVGNDGRGLMKSTDEVLARWRVDAGLTANRGVDHGEQCRWHLDEWQAAHICGRDEPRQVADDTTAERHDGRVAAEAVGEHRVGERAPHRSCLLLLARWNGVELRAPFAERGTDASRV